MEADQYRAWDTKKELMIYNSKNVVVTNVGVLTFDTHTGKIHILPLSRCIVMRYAGWTDKSGVKLYQGDLIKYRVDWEPFLLLSALVLTKYGDWMLGRYNASFFRGDECEKMGTIFMGKLKTNQG